MEFGWEAAPGPRGARHRGGEPLQSRLDPGRGVRGRHAGRRLCGGPRQPVYSVHRRGPKTVPRAVREHEPRAVSRRRAVWLSGVPHDPKGLQGLALE
ncbi:hypothetical protein CTRI78_v005239 [Colletotrichum trifolii]|uniref:Uncharacterized protein n=1 Tax=Colletotrichum trifolii TaxID=5466 RepID=A0A4R8RJP6_COLTR|nr:hypothetical protein CTRI78_v005239 [Colletotrichum trifolii]